MEDVQLMSKPPTVLFQRPEHLSEGLGAHWVFRNPSAAAGMPCLSNSDIWWLESVLTTFTSSLMEHIRHGEA